MDGLVEKVARAMEPATWAEELPVPTRAHTIAFHEGRARSVANARAAIEAVFDALATDLSDEAVQAGVDAFTNPRDIFAAMLATLRKQALG